MICISIAQESRRFALADMINASRQCDLLEVRLDRFAKAAEVGELLAAKPKPVILSCRRQQDGGDWKGSEEDRLSILRQCIISKADYVEIELDIADQIRRFPPAKRVISYTNFQETPSDIVAIYAEAQSKQADVVKLVTLVRTPEEAWPLVQILAKPALPTVVVGLGKPGIMLTILGKKIGAPWTYAALERGMEAYPGQPTVRDLEEVYAYKKIERSTPLLGVTGFGEADTVTVAALNAAFAQLDLPTRCLPLAIGSMRVFRKIIDAVKLVGVIVDEQHRGEILEIATDLDEVAKQSQAADLIVRKDKIWHAHNVFQKAAVAALEAVLHDAEPRDQPLQGRQVMIVGANAMARALAHGVKAQGAIPIIASRDRDQSLELAQTLDCRCIAFEALYTTMHDVLAICSEEKLPASSKSRSAEAGVHAGYLKTGMTVMDLTAMPRKSAFLRAAAAHGCHIVSPRRILTDQLAKQLKLLTGKEVAGDSITAVLQNMLEEDEDRA